MRISRLSTQLLMASQLWISMASTLACAAEHKIALCHAGLIKLAPFAQHIKALRAAKRYEPKDIDKLIAQVRKGGADFFSSQVIVQEEQSGSGTFDLRLYHGLSTAVDYRNITAWTCEHEDYPIVYFVGFRVRQIEDDTILLTREKDIVNVISLKALDPTLVKHVRVKIFDGDKVLCEDIGKGCDQGIFYSRE
jgi:hypothetical protein